MPKSNGSGNFEILVESQSKDKKAVRLFETLWNQPPQVFFVSACFGILGATFPDAAAAWYVVFYVSNQIGCEAAAACWCIPGALTCIPALVEFGLVLKAGVSVTVSGFVGAMRPVGITTSGQADLQRGTDERPPWKSLPGAAAASMGPGSCLEADKVVENRLAFLGSKAVPEIPARTCLVRSLTGRTLVCSLPAGYTMDDVERCASECTALPRHTFFLTFQWKRLSAGDIGGVDLTGLVPLVMHGRLCGGSAVPGAWACNICHASGCWPTRSRCFRCGNPGSTGTAVPVLLPLHPPQGVKKPILEGLPSPKLLR